MIKEIENLLDVKVRLQKWSPSGLPNYIVYNRTFYMLDASGICFIAVEIKPEDKADIRSLKSQVKKISDVSECPVVLCFSSIRKLQMEALIRNKIPFIVPKEQIYMPFLGIALSNKCKDETNETEHVFTPSAQMLFLMLLYNKDDAGILKKDAAEYLGITKTSVTRASQQLLELGLIKENREGRSIHITPTARGYQYYKKAKEYLISPVQKKILVKNSADFSGFIVAGETALARYSLLNEPRISSYACDKKKAEIYEENQLDKKWQSDYESAEIECWKYAPELFAKNGVADPVSLACSFNRNNDERIENEVEIMLEEYKW